LPIPSHRGGVSRSACDGRPAAKLSLAHPGGCLMRRFVISSVMLGSFALSALLSLSVADSQSDRESQSRIKRGFGIAPVPLNLRGKNRAKVGLGSYYVNA